MKILKLFIYLVLIIGLILFLLWKRSPTLTDPVATVEQPGTYTSMPYVEFNKLIPQRIEHAKEKSTFLEPYNHDKLEFIQQNIGSVKDMQKFIMLASVPNIEMGYYQVAPITQDPKVLSSFQFEQGMTGWFWIYGTFVDSAGNTASFMYYLIRLDMFPPELRKEMNLPMGSTTYYFISTGVGRGNEWKYSPFMFVRGEYNIKSDSSFSFNAIDAPEGWTSKLNMDGVGNFVIESGWTDSTGKKNGFAVNMEAERRPFLDNPGGCTPCAGGAGTLYFSYTQLATNGNITLNDSAVAYNNGTGWVDRQWLNRQVTTVYYSLLANVMNVFKSETRGLGKYVWLNLHLGKDLQYMVSGNFGPNDTITKGTVFPTNTNRYGPNDDVQWKIKGVTGEVLDTLTTEGITFPIKYKITTPDGVYILDATKFPHSVSIDLTNNLHYNGSALVYDTTGKLVGTGFMEANQFAPPAQYTTNVLEGMGLPVNAQNIAMFSSYTELPFSQGLPSLLLAISVVILLIALIILFIKTIFKKPDK
jgi:hypothetical protein